LNWFIPATIRAMYSRTASDRRKLGRSLAAGDGASVGSDWLAGTASSGSWIPRFDGRCTAVFS